MSHQMQLFRIYNADAAYDAFDASDLATLPPGSVLRFDINEHTYAALFVDDRWFVTGREAPNGASPEDFLGWLIIRNVVPADCAIMVGSRRLGG